jgi:beta-N-acetylhexosaminidase
MNKLLLSLLVVVAIILLGFLPKKPIVNDPPFLNPQSAHWADSVLQTLTLEERIGQLMMVAAFSDAKKQNTKEVAKLVKESKIGGVMFLKGTPVKQASMTNYFQSLSTVPLLVAIDGEWGLGMRLDSTVSFPRQMMLGAIQNNVLIYEMGEDIARQCKRIGIHVNFAPDADVNNNPLNPVIGSRSFGENKFMVTNKALMYMKGMQDAGIIANAKHFPGHGDTDADSHKTLPTVNSSKERMDTLELHPFKYLISQGISSMMVAHLNIPAYDTAKNTPSTLSKPIITGLLKEQLGFKGLVFTDALNMKGVSKYYDSGVLEVKALIAGNDVLLYPEDVPRSIVEIKKAIERGELTKDQIDERCRKVLMVKHWVGLNKYKKIATKKLYEELNDSKTNYLNRRLIEAALTVLKNKNDLIPLKRLDTLNIATVTLGVNEHSAFQQMVANYAPTAHFSLDRDAKQSSCDSLLKKLKPFNLIIVQVTNTNSLPARNFGITEQVVKTLNTIIRTKKTIADVFAYPYALAKLDSVHLADAVVLSYEQGDIVQELSAQLIFGGIQATGKLPVTASSYFKLGDGIETSAPIRLKYTLPDEVGADYDELKLIDSIALKGIKDKAYPGCQILIAKDGKVFYQKAFGYFTYEKKQAVTLTDLYDIASITKIAASIPSVMQLVDQRKITLDDSLSQHLPYLTGSNKEGIIFRDMLTHQAGLRDWIPFWMRTVKPDGNYKEGIYSTDSSAAFPYRVAEKLYINASYRDTIYKEIVKSDVKDKGKLRYSDLGYYFIRQLVEQKSNLPFEEYVRSNFYKPLGLTTMGYQPRYRFNLVRIAPTEIDVKFRKQMLRGDVHDQGAAMLGGVGGHAGLFSNANDLAILMQLYLQKGEYGGMRYFDSLTVKTFTSCPFYPTNRRGIGFDKPEMNRKKENPVCDSASEQSFGHTGFTGTMVWVDPKTGLVYVFLSNRVYPDADVNKLAKLGIRTRIQQVIYESFK